MSEQGERRDRPGKKKPKRARAAADRERAPFAVVGNVWVALAVTIVVPLAIALLPAVNLPTVDAEGILEAAHRLGMHGAAVGGGAFGLGVMPFMSASVLVELVALVVPAWARLRVGGPAGRAKLGRAVGVVAVLLAALQAFGVASMIASLPGAGHRVSVPLIIATLVAGSALLALVADFVSRRGLVSGYVLIMAAVTAIDVGREVARPRLGGSGVWRGIPATLAGLVVGAAATWLVLRARKPSLRLEPARSADPYRGKGEAAAALHVDVPLPPAGILPLLAVASLEPLVHPFGRAFTFDGMPGRVVGLGAVVLLAVVLAPVFYGPRRVAELWRAAGSRVATADLAGAARALLRRGVAISVLYGVGLFAVSLGVRFAGGASSIVLIGALLAAVGLDVSDSFRASRRHRALAVVWTEPRVYAIAIAEEILGAAGIPLFVRGERFNCISPFVPFAPLDMMVPVDEAARASRLLEAALAPKHAIAQTEPDVRAAPSVPPGSRWAIAASAVFGVAALVIPQTGDAPARPRGPARPESLQLLAVDDELDFFGSIAHSAKNAPQCLSFETETAPIGPNKQAVRRYATCKPEGKMTLAAARAEFAAWAGKLELPAGHRLGVGWVNQFDEDTEKLERVGVRSYLLEATPVIDGTEVKSAEARIKGEHGLEQAVVTIELTPAGADKFYRFTAANVGKRMAIVVDGDVSSAPRISSAISGGHVQITMGAGDPLQQIEDANRLANELMGRGSSAAPAPASGR